MHSATRAAPGLALVLLPALVGCAPLPPGPRTVHVIDGKEVSSRPPSPTAYEAYMRARLCLELEPKCPQEAVRLLTIVQRTAPDDAHVWAVRAQAHAMAGDPAAARRAAERALALNPGEGTAKTVLASLPGSSAKSQATARATE